MQIFIILNIFSCGESIEDPNPPAAPEWAVSPASENLYKIGAYPFHNDDGTQLIWKPNSEEDISGYIVYRSSADLEDKFEIIADVNAFGLGGIDTTVIDNTVSFGTDYRYFLKAYDQAGNRSQSSDTIRYRLYEKVYLSEPTGTITDYQPIFKWHDNNYSNAGEYLIRLEALDTQEVIWISRFQPPNYGDFYQSIPYNKDGYANQLSLESGISYKWCIELIWLTNLIVHDSTQIEYSIGGSMSNWEYFSVD